MHTEENQPHPNDSRYDSTARNPSLPQEPGGALASPPRAEGWSAFTPANDGLEDILLIPEEPVEASAEPVVQAEVLEDVFGVEEDSPASSAGESLVVAGSGEPRAGVDEGVALRTSAATPAQEEPAPVENLRAQAPTYDKYAVGMRILRVSPVWLLLSTFGFLSVIMLFGWMSQPAAKVEASALDAAVKNEASSRPLASARADAPEAAPAEAEAPAPAPTAKEEPRQQAAQEPQQPAQESRAQEAAPPAETTAARGNFTIQVGSYPDVSQANERVSALRASGFEARAAAVELPKRGTWYRVQAGRFLTREEAARFGAQLRAKGAAENVFVAEVEKR